MKQQYTPGEETKKHLKMHDFLRNPLGAVEFTFEKALSSDSETALKGNHWGETDLFLHFLTNGGLSKVPFLNSESIRWLQPNTLVRFRGMIQDMPGSEMYVGAYKDGDVWRTNKYTDPPKYSSGVYQCDSYIWRRRLIYCIPVPGQNDWTEPSGSCMHLKTSGNKKRQRDEDTAKEDADELDLSCQAEEFPCPKRMREGDIATSSSSLQGVPAEVISSMTMVLSKDGIQSLSCLVKIYHSPESDLNFNDVFEFVGILALDKKIQMEKVNQVPRLHCLLHQKLLLSDFLPGPVSLESKPHPEKSIREALLAHLTSLLGNDCVAAHFMLLHLLSSVRSSALGKPSLNLTSLTNDNISVFKDRILFILKNLLPFTHDLRLTVELLNAGPFSPRKDNESNRLEPGALPLANGSHLTIDVTEFGAEFLNSTGIDNALVLASLRECQQVGYDFTNHKKGMPVDVQLLILSGGNSNVFGTDIVLPFSPSSVDSPETPNADTLAAWRWYLATVRSFPHTIDHEMQKVLKNDLIALHQIDPSLDGRDLRRLVIMARLVCVSFGESSLLMEHWKMAKKLERLRRERLHRRM